jgi:rhodanese-related sulfurtransferase
LSAFTVPPAVRYLPSLLAVFLFMFSACATRKPYTDPGGLADLVSGKGEKYVLVDVRTPEEYACGHIPTAVNIPVDLIAERPPSRDTSALVIVYCARGGRAAAAARTLENLGFTRVVNFGGIPRWKGRLVTGDKPG